jgi:hypothetical protein
LVGTEAALVSRSVTIGVVMQRANRISPRWKSGFCFIRVTELYTSIELILCNEQLVRHQQRLQLPSLKAATWARPDANSPLESQVAHKCLYWKGVEKWLAGRGTIQVPYLPSIDQAKRGKTRLVFARAWIVGPGNAPSTQIRSPRFSFWGSVRFTAPCFNFLRRVPGNSKLSSRGSAWIWLGRLETDRLFVGLAYPGHI